jgi:hypothetical protein
MSSTTTADTAAMTKIRKARLKLLFSNPFFGQLAMDLPPVDATDWIPTAAVDGRNIYYNRDFVNGLTVDETVFLWAHEIMHCVYDHLRRTSHRNRKISNMSQDYVINALLIDEKIGDMITKAVDVKDNKTGENAQRVGLYDPRYLGWTSEAVYDDLISRKVEETLTLDVHIDPNGAGGEENGEGDNDKNSGGNPLNISDEDMKKIREAFKDKIISAAQAAAGKIPAGINRLIGNLVEPKINWRDFIQQTIVSQLTSDYAYHRPSRRNTNADVFLPSLVKEETISVEVFVDMSGSITQEMARDCASEIYGVAQQYADFNIAISTFDTKIYNRQEFTPDNVDEMLEYQFLGGGGTDISVCWEYMKKHDIRPKLVIVFTDLESHNFGDPDYCQTLWIINNPWNKNIEPPFGQWVRYSPKEGVVENGSAG